MIVDGHAGHLSTRTKYAAPGPATILCNRHPLQRVRPSASPLRRQREAVSGVRQARSPRPASTHQGLGKASGGSGRRESATLGTSTVSSALHVCETSASVSHAFAPSAGGCRPSLASQKSASNVHASGARLASRGISRKRVTVRSRFLSRSYITNRHLAALLLRRQREIASRVWQAKSQRRIRG